MYGQWFCCYFHQRKIHELDVDFDDDDDPTQCKNFVHFCVGNPEMLFYVLFLNNFVYTLRHKTTSSTHQHTPPSKLLQQIYERYIQLYTIQNTYIMLFLCTTANVKSSILNNLFVFYVFHELDYINIFFSCPILIYVCTFSMGSHRPPI